MRDEISGNKLDDVDTAGRRASVCLGHIIAFPGLSKLSVLKHSDMTCQVNSSIISLRGLQF